MGVKTDTTNFQKHHAKPFRKRHLSAFAISFLLFAFMLLQLGILQGINQAEPQPVAADSAANTNTKIQSRYGFSFTVDTDQLTVIGDPTSRDLTNATIKPRVGTVDRSDAAATVRVQINPDTSLLKQAIASPANAVVPAEQAAVQLFPPTTDKRITTKIISAGQDSVGGAVAYKTVYALTPNFGGTSYAVVWTGIVQGRAFAVSAQGLTGSPAVPPAFTDFFKQLQIASDQQVKGEKVSLLPVKAAAHPSKLDPKYLSDAVSPAVVKIYHVVCGSLAIQGKQVLSDGCTGFTGSGFMATSNGYIATNGHVVVYTAQDALVDALIASPLALNAFMRGIGMTGDQIARMNTSPAETAAVISKIYDIPDNQLNFNGNKALTLVSLGSTPPLFEQLNSSADLDKYAHDRGEIRVAKIIGYNYSGKDKLTAIADPTKGFSASDVALIKVDVTNAPTIAVSHDPVVQNQKIVVLGFPGDADNQLTDNTQLVPSVTDGVISSIRQAAGKSGTLYQSDADASHGNSGGPAIDETGKAIGLLTYRAAGDETGNAAKSYIREISDFTDLAAKLDVPISSTSSTQQAWQQGLQLYAKNHYSAALIKFQQVQNAYPSHRLADDYIANAQTAITNGKDVKQLSSAWLIAGMAAAFGLAAISIGFIVRHHGVHQTYKAFNRDVAALPGLHNHVH